MSGKKIVVGEKNVSTGIDLSKLSQQEQAILFAQLSKTVSASVKADVAKSMKSDEEKAVETFNRLLSAVHDVIGKTISQHANGLVDALSVFRKSEDGPKTSKSLKGILVNHKGKTVRVVPSIVFDFEPPKRSLTSDQKLRATLAETAKRNQEMIDKAFAEVE